MEIIIGEYYHHKDGTRYFIDTIENRIRKRIYKDIIVSDITSSINNMLKIK